MPRSRIAVAALAATAATWAGGCDDADQRPAAAESEAGVAVAAERPHFVGRRELLLAVGAPDSSSDCDEDTAPEWVCDPGAGRSEELGHGGVRVVLEEARMDVAGGGTSWRVTLRFASGDRAELRTAREGARRTDAPLLVLEGQQVLAVAAPRDSDGRVIRLSRMTKPAAWDLVDRLASD